VGFWGTPERTGKGCKNHQDIGGKSVEDVLRNHEFTQSSQETLDYSKGGEIAGKEDKKFAIGGKEKKDKGKIVI